MPVIIVKTAFEVAVENGNRIIEMQPGEHDVDERVAVVATEHLKVATLKKAGRNGNTDSGTGQTKTEN